MSAPQRRKGKPNRGGGRFNSSRGSGGGGGGRGRGRGVQRGRGGGGGHGGGGFCGGKKGGDSAAAMGYLGDSVVVGRDDYDDYDNTPRVTVQPSVAAAAPVRRRTERKVVMQQLQMSMQNQMMVKDMLNDLHLGDEMQDGGDEWQAGDKSSDLQQWSAVGDTETEYDEIDWRADDQYWTSDTNLVVQQVERHAPPLSWQQTSRGNEKGSTENAQQTHVDGVSQLAVKQLERYGFHTTRCSATLKENSGDLGLSLECLLSNCFDVPLRRDETNNGLNDFQCPTTPEILEQRSEEKMALESIYGDRFIERIPNRVWVVLLELPHLTDLIGGANKRTNKTLCSSQQLQTKRYAKSHLPVCKFFQKGFCRFGQRCKNRHEKPDTGPRERFVPTYDDDDDEGPGKLPYQLHVRFPPGNRYPYEVPLVAFLSTDEKVPQHTCLNVSFRLMQEARQQVGDSAPAVFSLISILEDVDELRDIVTTPALLYSRPEIKSPPKLSEKQRTDSKNNVENGVATKKVPSSTMDYSKETKQVFEKVQKEQRKKYDGRRSTDLYAIRKNDQKLVEQFQKVQHSDAYKAMLVQRRKLPAWDNQDKILDALYESQVLVISGMTGCGKTTQVPQFILDDHLVSDGPLCNIICTQPRRISAIAVAERVADERIDRLGNAIGYHIRLENVMSASTRLLFCSTGILLRRLEGDVTLDGVTHVIVDEVHERTEESDFLMMVLRDLLPNRPDLKVILMSATLNADLISGYFNHCPVIDIPGKAFSVDQYFLEDAIEFTRYVLEERSEYAISLKRANDIRHLVPEMWALDDDDTTSSGRFKDNTLDQSLNLNQLAVRYEGYSRATLKTLAKLDFEKINNDLIELLIEWIMEGKHKYPADGAILIFLPGMMEIMALYNQLLANPAIGGGRGRNRVKLVPLHSTLSSDEQHAVFSRPQKGVTKIILSTNIAETSITIDDVVYVIDTGRMKEKRYDPSKGMESLDVAWVSKANAIQRKGRAGRVAAGVSFHLFSSHHYEYMLKDQPTPEIQRVPLEQLVLKIKKLDLFSGQDVSDVLFRIIEAPQPVNINCAIERLTDLGAIDAQQELTALGYHLAALPVDVRIGKLMLFGAIFRCLDSALTIAASLSSKSPFVSPFDRRDEADAKKREFSTANSDHLTVLRAYKEWINVRMKSPRQRSQYTFCQDHFLSSRTLEMLGSMKRQFIALLSDIGFVQEGLTVRRLDRMTRDGNDGIIAASGPEANSNNDNMKLVSAILVAALYPNVVQVLTPESKYSISSAGAIPQAPKAQELKFKTKNDGYVHIHPSSVNFLTRHYDSPYLVYHEKIKTSKVYIRDCTMVSVYPLLLFGGGSIRIDLDQGNFVMSVDDGWIRIRASSHQVAELVKELRQELDSLLEEKIETPHMDLCTCPHGSRIIDTIVKLISSQ